MDRDQQGAARLIKILGGMPLAVEIAARHLSESLDTSFSEYIGWVRGKVKLLNIEGNPDKDVIATLTLSLDALADEADGEILLALFEAISVCAETGFRSETLGSAAGYKDMDRMLLGPLVGKLHHRSLLEFSEESQRYAAHPLVHQIAESRLEQDENREKEFRQNHCQYFLEFANGHSHNPHELIAEKDGLWQAMVQTMQVGWQDEKLPLFLKYLSKPYWEYFKAGEYQIAFNYLKAINLITIDNLGQSKELVELLTPLYQNQSRLDDRSQGWMLNSLGMAIRDLGEYRRAIEVYEAALKIFYRIEDIRSEGAVLGNMGLAYSSLGEYRRTIELYEQALEIQRRIGDVQGEANALGNMGLAYSYLGENHRAIGFYEQQLKITRRMGDSLGEGKALGNIGTAYAQLGEYRKAIEFYEQRIEMARRIGDIRGEAHALGNLGNTFRQLGEYSQAIEFHEQALEIDHRIGDIRGEGEDLGNMGLTYVEMGQKEKALEYLEAAKSIFERMGLEHMVRLTEENLKVLGLKS